MKQSLLIASFCTLLVACGTIRQEAALTPGSITFSRPVPEISLASSEQISPLGFLPIKESASENVNFIEIDKNSSVLSIADKKISFVSNNFDKDGKVSVVHKQKQPIWYANDQYFEARKLPVPAKGHADRFLRGVLGEEALFLDEETAIYSSTLGALSPAKGLQVSEKDLAFLFNTIAVGTTVRVK